MPLPQFRYYAPSSLEEVFSILDGKNYGARLLAGGTDLLVKMKQRAIDPVPEHLVSLKNISNYDYIVDEGSDGLRIGALARIQTIKSFIPIRQFYPGLSQAASLLSTPQIRNIATIGGNLCNASPAAETASPLITLSAKVKIMGKKGERIVPMEKFFLGPGKTVLGYDDFLAEVQIPVQPSNSSTAYVKNGKRLSDIAIVGLALYLQMEDDVCSDAKIAITSAGPTPMRTPKAEAMMIGQKFSPELVDTIAKMVSDEAKPIDDMRGTAALRRERLPSLFKEALGKAVEQIKVGCC